MKKFSCIMLAFALAVVIVACNRGSGSGNGASGGAAAGGSVSSGGSSASGSSASSGVNYTMANESDFTVALASAGTARITGYTGRGGNIAIPATIQGVQVTEIGEEAFYNKGNVTGVQLPEGLKVIRNDAFYLAGISTIIIPNTVIEIGENAFGNCRNLESISIPDSVTVFGLGIFRSSGLKSFTFPAGWIATKEISGNGGVEYLSMFRNTKLEKIVIPEGIETIGQGAFAECENLTSVTLPSTIRSIGDWAFQGCTNLTEVIIPESVTSIRFGGFDGSFRYCSKLNLASQAALKRVGWSGWID